MFRKTPLLIREICWIIATIALYLSMGWFVWEIWSATWISPRSVIEVGIAFSSILLICWGRRYLRRVVRGPLYRNGMQAYMIGEMRHT